MHRACLVSNFTYIFTFQTTLHIFSHFFNLHVFQKITKIPSQTTLPNTLFIFGCVPMLDTGHIWDTSSAACMSQLSFIFFEKFRTQLGYRRDTYLLFLFSFNLEHLFNYLSFMSSVNRCP